MTEAKSCQSCGARPNPNVIGCEYCGRGQQPVRDNPKQNANWQQQQLAAELIRNGVLSPFGVQDALLRRNAAEQQGRFNDRSALWNAQQQQQQAVTITLPDPELERWWPKASPLLEYAKRKAEPEPVDPESHSFLDKLWVVILAAFVTIWMVILDH